MTEAMGTYKLNGSYEAYRDGVRFGPWVKGDLVNLDEADAEWVERDSPGVLGKVADKKAPDAPGVPVPAAGARPRVGGDPERAEVAAVAQERVHAEARERQAPAAEPVDDEGQDEGQDEVPVRQPRRGRGGANRAG